MAVNLYFTERFVPAIKAGTKCQTIRWRQAVPCKVGDLLKLYHRIGTHKLMPNDPVCTSVESISISPRTGVVSMVDGKRWRYLEFQEVEALAKADGFADVEEFFDFFQKQYGQTFSGYLIKWSHPQPAHERSPV